MRMPRLQKFNAMVTNPGSVQIGNGASVPAPSRGVAIGDSASASWGSTIGPFAKAANGANAGEYAQALSGGAVGSHATTQGGCAVGTNTTSQEGAAIGWGAIVQTRYGSAIGTFATVSATEDATLRLGGSASNVISSLKFRVALRHYLKITSPIMMGKLYNSTFRAAGFY